MMNQFWYQPDGKKTSYGAKLCHSCQEISKAKNKKKEGGVARTMMAVNSFRSHIFGLRLGRRNYNFFFLKPENVYTLIGSW